MKSTVSAYRTSALESATHLDVLLACYDALAEDIRLAGHAAAKDDFAARCRYSHHAILVLGHLEDWIPLLQDAPLEESLRAFYQYVRKTLLHLQVSVQTAEFADLAMAVCETRAVWQKKNSTLNSEIHRPSEPQSGASIPVAQPRLYCSA